MEMLEDLILTLRTRHQPVIAAVNGAAGFERHMRGEGLGQHLVRLLTTGNFEEAVVARNQ